MEGELYETTSRYLYCNKWIPARRYSPSNRWYSIGTMKTKSAKAKGRKLQNLVALQLLEVFPNLNHSDCKPQLMGGTGMDIQLSTEARKDIPFSFECKNQEALNIWEAIKQAEANAEGLTPAVVFSRNRQPEPYVAIPLTAFLRLVRNERAREKLLVNLTLSPVTGAPGYAGDPPPGRMGG